MLKIKEDIKAYVEKRTPPGAFLIAVLSNNFMDAYEIADDITRLNIVEIFRYVRNETPALCHGSPEQVLAWLNEEE